MERDKKQNLEEGEIFEAVYDKIARTLTLSPSIDGIFKMLKSYSYFVHSFQDLMSCLHSSVLKLSQQQFHMTKEKREAAESFIALYTLLETLGELFTGYKTLFDLLRIKPKLNHLLKSTNSIQNTSSLEIEKWFKIENMDSENLELLSIAKVIQTKKLKKMVLMIDLDHTLVHCLNPFDIAYSFTTIHPEGAKSIVIRESADLFLRSVSHFCRCHIYTHAFKDYALKVKKLLDPSSQYFSRLVAPSNPNLAGMKSLSSFAAVYPKELVDHSSVLILDDQMTVWIETEYVIPIMPFFASIPTQDNFSFHPSLKGMNQPYLRELYIETNTNSQLEDLIGALFETYRILVAFNFRIPAITAFRLYRSKVLAGVEISMINFSGESYVFYSQLALCLGVVITTHAPLLQESLEVEEYTTAWLIKCYLHLKRI